MCSVLAQGGRRGAAQICGCRLPAGCPRYGLGSAECLQPGSGPAGWDINQKRAAACRERPAGAHEVSLHGSRQAGLAPAQTG